MVPTLLLLLWLAPQGPGIASAPCGGPVGAQAQIDNEVCLGNEALKRGEAAPKQSPQRAQLFEAAADLKSSSTKPARSPTPRLSDRFRCLTTRRSAPFAIGTSRRPS